MWKGPDPDIFTITIWDTVDPSSTVNLLKFEGNWRGDFSPLKTFEDGSIKFKFEVAIRSGRSTSDNTKTARRLAHATLAALTVPSTTELLGGNLSHALFLKQQ